MVSVRFRPVPKVRALLAAFVVFALVPAGAVGAELMPDPGGAGAFGMQGGPGDTAVAREQMRDRMRGAESAEVERQERLASPEARAERERSETAFEGLSDLAAIKLLRGEFAGELRPPVPDAETLVGPDDVSVFYSDYVAVVHGVGDRPDRLIESQVALRTPDTEKIVDLDLALEGTSFAPADGLVDVELSAQVSAGLDVGPVTVSPEGSARASKLDSDTLVYPNTVTDTDVAVNLTPAGFETYHQLRSAKP